MVPPLDLMAGDLILVIGASVPNRAGARWGPAGGLPRAPDGMARDGAAICSPSRAA